MSDRGIYAFEFEDKSVYIGLTGDFKQRLYEHQTSDTTVSKKINAGYSYIFKEVHEYTEETSASSLEQFYVDQYKEDGWAVLNISKPGSLGGGKIIWTIEMCIDESKKYNTQRDWRKGSQASFSAAIRLKCFNACINHMTKLSEKGKWTKEACKKDAEKYTGRRQWSKASPGAYNAAKDHKWLDYCCSHMERKIVHGKWTLEVCKQDALKYKVREHWRKNSNGYYAAYLKGWMSECCAHMERSK